MVHWCGCEIEGHRNEQNELSTSEKEAGLQCPVSMELAERLHWAQLQLSLLRFYMPLALAWAKYHQVSSAWIPTPTSFSSQRIGSYNSPPVPSTEKVPHCFQCEQEFYLILKVDI